MRQRDGAKRAPCRGRRSVLSRLIWSRSRVHGRGWGQPRHRGSDVSKAAGPGGIPRIAGAPSSLDVTLYAFDRVRPSQCHNLVLNARFGLAEAIAKKPLPRRLFVQDRNLHVALPVASASGVEVHDIARRICAEVVCDRTHTRERAVRQHSLDGSRADRTTRPAVRRARWPGRARVFAATVNHGTARIHR